MQDDDEVRMSDHSQFRFRPGETAYYANTAVKVISCKLNGGDHGYIIRVPDIGDIFVPERSLYFNER